MLDTYDKPSYPCLFTRFPYGEEINDEKLSRVAKAEEKLKELNDASAGRSKFYQNTRSESVESI